MKFAATVLGSGSAKPTLERLTSAHVLNVHEHFYLIDCGEGTQVAMIKHGIQMMKIEHAFISHLHGDHYFGLIGLLNSMHLMNRKKPFHLYAFCELEEIINIQLRVASTTFSFPLVFHPLDSSKTQEILNNKYVSVTSFPLKHRIRTCGFLFKEKKRARNIKREFVRKHNIPVEWFQRILDGEDYVDADGVKYSNDSIVKIPGVSRSYAYCSDTAYHKEVVDIIRGASLLYHEASFADEHEDIALVKFHSTARQAAMIAKEANVGGLMIGHFSLRYKDPQLLLSQAREEFPNTIEAVDGLTVEIGS